MIVSNGKITIAKWTGPNSHIEIEIMDGDRVVAARVDIRLAEFADALTGMGCVDCVVKLPDKT